MAGRSDHLKPEADCMEPGLQAPHQLQMRLRFLQEAVDNVWKCGRALQSASRSLAFHLEKTDLVRDIPAH